jgi:hypothetical protein
MSLIVKDVKGFLPGRLVVVGFPGSTQLYSSESSSAGTWFSDPSQSSDGRLQSCR